MKKQTLFLAFICLLALKSNAQDYYYLKSTGTLTDYSFSDHPNDSNLIRGNPFTPISNKLSESFKIPFDWYFYGQQVSYFKASTSGFITFDTTLMNDISNNDDLSMVLAPANSIFAFWDNTQMMGYTTFPSDIRTFTYGSFGSRTFVIQWRLVGTSGQATPLKNITYYAIRLYEQGNFDIVHNYGFGTFTATTGTLNYDANHFTQVTGSPNLNYGGNNGSYDAKLSTVYKFIYGNQPNNDVGINSVVAPKYKIKNTPINFTGKLTNWGTQKLTSVKLSYSVDGKASVSMQLSSINILPNGGFYNFYHNVPYIGTIKANSTVKFWASLPNGQRDEDSSNNNGSTEFTILDSTIKRMVLHEVFTSSTCPPCLYGNENVKSVLNSKQGSWNMIKYQENFPGPGDPYYTSENGSRFAYYGLTYAPWLLVDGAYNDNANNYNATLFDGFNSYPSFVSIGVNFSKSGKTVTVSGDVIPVQTFENSGLRLRIAILERVTTSNARSNGETEFYNVNKKMLPDAYGIPINLAAGTPVSYSQSYTFPGNYRLPADGQNANIIDLSTENSVENFNDLYAVTFIQDDADKTIPQSAASAPVWILGSSEIEELGLTLFPNPANTSFTLSYSNKLTEGLVKIMDMNGREVLSQVINEANKQINCEHLQNGIYFVELTANGKKAIKKLNIIR